ncbi:MAG: hypothetical protein F2813_07225, partial [Actinobacteria bacterium]|nr:hypothetical protein [Actinomycetota bacterium]
MPTSVAAAGMTERSERIRKLLAVSLLVVAGLIVSGFTVLRRIDPLDEGVMLQAVERIVSGQVPYRDFLWPYGPGQPYLLSGIHHFGGASLLDWRLVRVAADSATALTVFLIVSGRFSWRWALAAWFVAILSISEPASANPFSLALLASLVALSVAAGAHSSKRPAGAAALAGVICALAAAWRPDAGVFAFLAVAATLMAAPTAGRLRRTIYAAVAAIVAGLLVYLPFVLLASPRVMYDALLGTPLRDGAWWRLPFVVMGPTSVDFSSPAGLAGSLNDLLGQEVAVLLLVALGCCAAAIALRWQRSRE